MARLLRDINEGPNGSAWSVLGEAGDRLFFVAGERGPRFYPRRFGMWVSDGTRGGTRRIHDPSDSWGDTGPRVDFVGDDGGALLFAKRAPIDPPQPEVWQAGSGGFNLWRSDGTAEDTRPVVDESGRLVGIDTDIVWLGDHYYFGGYDQERGNALLRVEAGSSVAHTVRAFSPKYSARWGKPKPIAVLGDRILFTLNDREHGQELWVSDGTETGTDLLLDIVPGKGSMQLDQGLGTERSMVVMDDRLFFQAFRSGEEHLGSWVTDGTASGTEQLTDASLAFGPLPDGGPIVVAGEDEEHGREPWLTDGTAEGTMLLVDITPGPADGFTDHILGDRAGIPVQGWLTEDSPGGLRYFVGDDGVHGPEPWVTDGTSEGTRMLLDISPELGRGSDPSPAEVIGERVYFSADDGVNGRQLWVTSGDPDTTAMITAIDLAGRPVSQLVADQGSVFVALQESGGRMSLWRLDDAAGNATRIWRGKARAMELRRLENELFFAPIRAHGATLWMTDGTPRGTTRVTARKGRSIQFDPWSSPLEPVGDQLLFYGDDGRHGLELWALHIPRE